MTTTVERVRELVEPLVAEADLDLYDLDLAGGVLSVLVDAPGGADIDAISRVARSISRALDEHDPIEGRYALEVGSPGLERPLRTPAHFAGAVGTTVKVKTQPGVEGDRRVEGTITAADDASVTVRTADGDHRTISYDDIERARTTFEWGAAAKPDKKKKAGTTS
ncbi:MAG: ribosome maturation factor RimP [Acidimicrobiales bacterium]